MRELGGENISHCGNGFPRILERGGGCVGGEGAGEFKAEKVVVVKMADPDRFGADYSRSGGQTTGRAYGGAGDFEGNHGSFRQGTTNNDQGSASRNVNRGGEFQGFFARLVAGTDENRNGELQAGPFTFVFGQNTVFHVRYTCQKRR